VKKLKRRRRIFGKTEMDGDDWFLDDPHKSVNVEGRIKGKLYLCTD
jgi:hypothetical protein